MYFSDQNKNFRAEYPDHTDEQLDWFNLLAEAINPVTALIFVRPAMQSARGRIQVSALQKALDEWYKETGCVDVGVRAYPDSETEEVLPAELVRLGNNDKPIYCRAGKLAVALASSGPLFLRAANLKRLDRKQRKDGTASSDEQYSPWDAQMNGWDILPDEDDPAVLALIHALEQTQ